MIQRSYKRIMRIKNFHETRGIPYKAIIQNESISFISELNEVRNRSDFPPNELWFIGAVKEEILRNQLHKGIRNYFKKEGSESKIKYFYFNKRFKPGDVLTGLMEVDMKSAYFEMARHMGLISDKLYERCINPKPPLKPISKQSRLAAIGSLARKRYVIEFDGTKQVEFPPERQTETEYLWNTICYRVGKIMARVAKKCGPDFVFFWVDAMFIRPEAVAMVKKMFKDAGFEFSVDPVKSITFEQKNIVVKGKQKRRKLSEAAISAIKKYRKELFGTGTVPRNAVEQIVAAFKAKGHTILPEAVQAGLRGKDHYWTEVRPFPYKHSLTEQQIHELASQSN